MTTYPLSPQGVFWTLNGEGVLFGTPQVFIRLAGCDVACPDCDTDYSVSERVDCREIARRVVNVASGTRWVWITGGEPTIHDLTPLVVVLRQCGFRIAVATAGEREIPRGATLASVPGGFDFVSVSPHRFDRWKQQRGEQVNIVPGLNGLRLADVEGLDFSGFDHKFVTPIWYAAADRMERVAECVAWVKSHPDWRLGCQMHKAWGLA